MQDTERDGQTLRVVWDAHLRCRQKIAGDSMEFRKLPVILPVCFVYMLVKHAAVRIERHTAGKMPDVGLLTA